MPRRKRTLVGEDTKNMTIKIRATVYDKLEAQQELIRKLTEALSEHRGLHGKRCYFDSDETCPLCTRTDELLKGSSKC